MKRGKYTLLLLILLLAGCKVDLYHDVPQEEANQMVALLLLNHIMVDTALDQKSGTVTLRVEQNDLINSVELLRQNGLPRPRYASIEDLFPSGQLVTSPAQEEAKMSYLKEQRIERTLSNIDGVVSAQVMIATVPQDMDSAGPTVKSASVYIKYSPQANLASEENQIKHLVQNAIPDLSYDRITVFLQVSNYHFKPAKSEMQTAQSNNLITAINKYKILIFAVLILFVLSLVAVMLAINRK